MCGDCAGLTRALSWALRKSSRPLASMQRAARSKQAERGGGGGLRTGGREAAERLSSATAATTHSVFGSVHA
eukprot:13362429-Alexandrium_andersonii.AAC.1